MANLERVIIEQSGTAKRPVIRLDWDNDWHQTAEIDDTSPLGVERALSQLARQTAALHAAEKI